MGTRNPMSDPKGAMISVSEGQYALLAVAGRTQAGLPAPIFGTVSISDYAKAYVNSTGTQNQYVMVPKVVVAPGDWVTVDVVFHATASDGSVLSDFAVNFTIVGSAAGAAVATEVVLEDSRVLDTAGAPLPPDPGSDTIQIF